MDTESLRLIRKVWRHSGVEGNVWMPHIANIGSKTSQRFREGAALHSRKPRIPQLRDDVDWYWTPAVSSSDSRKAKAYPSQRVLWVDCDESYNDDLLKALKPSYVWETSPGHKQAIWLLRDKISPDEYHRDGLMGLLTQALGGDKSGVDIGQLLRVPGTWHHKRDPYQGRLLRTTGTVYTRGQVLSRVAKGLGFPAGVASEIGADDPYGDRSKLLWKFERIAAEIGLPQDLTFKLLNQVGWNKWKDEPEKLREDIAKAYALQSEKAPEKEQTSSGDDTDASDEDVVSPWDLSSADSFGEVLRKPRAWILPGVIPEAACGILVAAPKVGKTRVAIEMALGLASGTHPLGINSRKPRNVAFFSLEDGEYLFAERLSESLNRDKGRYQFHWDGHISRGKDGYTWHPSRKMSFLTRFDATDFRDPENQQRLYETVLRYDLDLVIIDTLSMAIGNANVSDTKEMYEVLKPLKEISKATGCAVMFIHHTRKRVFEKGESLQERILGSTALHGWSDFILSLADPDEDNPDLRRLAIQTKMGHNQHYLSPELKIIKHAPQEE